MPQRTAIALRTASSVLLSAALLGAQTSTPPRLGTAEGRVLGPLGEPMVNVDVRAAIWPEVDTDVATTRTDGEGMFVLGQLPIGSIWLSASAPGLTRGQGVVSLTAEKPQDAVQMRLWPANVLRGRVVDQDGNAVPDAVVLGTKDFTWFDGQFRSPEMQTGPDGRFELAGVPIGDCVLRASAPGHLMCEHRLVALGDQDVEVRLERGEGAVLAVRARDLPPEVRRRTRVRCYPSRNGSGFSIARRIEIGHLDEQGCWRIAGLPPAEWHLELSLDGFTFDPRNVETKTDQPLRESSFTASALGSLQLRGALRSADGKPLAGERLVCRTKRSQSMNGGTPGEATTDADGHFVMNAPLVAGEPYSLHLVASRWALSQQKFAGMTGQWDARYLVRYEDSADSTRELDLVAQPAALVTARLLDQDDRPVPFAWTELQERNGKRHPEWMALASATSRRDGTVAFAGVHAGPDDRRVCIGDSAGYGASEPFRLAPGEYRAGVVRVQRPGTVTGHVLDALGKPVAGYRVSLRNYDVNTGKQTDGGWRNVPTGRDGRFAFVGVAPGGHKLENSDHEERACVSEVFDVRPGANVDVTLQLKQ